jgi:LacI family transcriptional regulator, galactose operon repressor
MARTLSQRPRRDAQRRRPSVTIKDVAAKAGVSVATISRVLNGKGPVRPATNRLVLATAKALHYVPHAAARSLSTRTTHTIGLLLPDLHGEFFSEVIRGIDGASRLRGYHLLVSGFHSERSEMTAMLEAVRGRVDGIIVMAPDRSALMSADEVARVPVVRLNSGQGYATSLNVDNYGGASAMVRHLASSGRKRIAFIRGPERNADASERQRGYRSAVRALGIAPQEFAGDFTEEGGYRAASELVKRRPLPDAIFAANDAMAIGALRALREAALAVPQEVALAGFDDIPIARYVTPALTTVNVAIAELGRRAFEMLLDEINGQSPSKRREKFPTRLVVRESCGSSVSSHPQLSIHRGGGKA